MLCAKSDDFVRKTGATLKAAALKHDPTSSACHTLQKTMFLRALALFWLICTLWHIVTTLPYLEPVNKRVNALYHKLRLLLVVISTFVKITIFTPVSIASFPLLAKYFPQVHQIQMSTV